MMRIPFETLVNQFEKVLLSRGMQAEDAKLCSYLVGETSAEGVYTHGANRFPFMVGMIDDGLIDVHAKPRMVASFGALERWDGRQGMGNLNAHAAMKRAIELAKQYTIGCVALAHTNHWMRPGTYGLMAAEADCIGMLWTNTMPLMPAWGGIDAKVGNNPLVLCIPAKDGPVLVDAAMSLFSYGKLETYAREGRSLPVTGGYDQDGNLTTDAKQILSSKRPLPIGFWKGTSLALALDLIVSALSGGNTTRQLGQMGKESSVSQIFIAINLASLPDRDRIEAEIHASLEDLQNSEVEDGSAAVRFPGQLRTRIKEENLREGIPIDERVWQKILSL
ncbi:MAG: 3-dehydro-L-gulonate 2-dehydrogenase [Spirochaetia bacterium]|nr:3-dehydro-L-gulonate 2-dehydrogenase [Spirochaetia bacterium]